MLGRDCAILGSQPGRALLTVRSADTLVTGFNYPQSLLDRRPFVRTTRFLAEVSAFVAASIYFGRHAVNYHGYDTLAARLSGSSLYFSELLHYYSLRARGSLYLS